MAPGGAVDAFVTHPRGRLGNMRHNVLQPCVTFTPNSHATLYICSRWPKAAWRFRALCQAKLTIFCSLLEARAEGHKFYFYLGYLTRNNACCMNGRNRPNIASSSKHKPKMLELNTKTCLA